MDYNYYHNDAQDYSVFGLPSGSDQGRPDRSFDTSPTVSRNPSFAFHADDDPENDLQQHTFAQLDPQFQYGDHAFVPQAASTNRSFGNAVPADQSNINSAYLPSDANEIPGEEWQRARSSSEDKETSTPSRDRRKEQNRAAQRAFRERKERHVKALEIKLAALEKDYTMSQSDNERLRRELAKIATENEILRATTSPSHPLNTNPYSISSKFVDEEPTETGPMHFVPTDSHNFAAQMKGHLNSKGENPILSQPGKVSTPYQMDGNSSMGERLLDAGATWDLIQEHELYKKGLVDIGDVCERLKKLAQCNGHGPSFEEAAVRQAIQESVAGVRDELI